MLCGNKCDLTSLRVVSEERVQNLAEKYDLVYIETSAYTGQNIRRAIDILLEKVMTRMEAAVISSLQPGRGGRIRQLRDTETKVLHRSEVKSCSPC